MTSPNQHIWDELERFRLQPGRSFYAIQVNAPWGAGKTYFVQNYLNEVTPAPLDDSGVANLHISLFGAQSIEDLERQVVAQLFSRSSRAIGSLISTAVSGFAGFFQFDNAAEIVAAKTRETVLSRRLEDVRKGLVVFDDIERSKIPLKDALGYINRFVEREGFKVVLISNEEALSRKDASAEEQANAVVLRAFKEKLVGRTLRLVADPEAAYPSFVAAMTSERAKEFASKEMMAALRLFRSSKRENLRSLRIGLEAFDRLVSALDPSLLAEQEGIRDILLGCLYVAIELGAAVDEAVIVEPHANRTRRIIAGIGNPSAPEPSAKAKSADDIIARYDDILDLRTPTIPFKLLIDFIAHGNLLIEEISLVVEISPLLAAPQDVPPWRKLVQIWDLDVDTLQESTAQALRQFEKSEIRDPGELLHLAGIMLWRTSRGDRTLSAGQDPIDFIQTYLDRLDRSGAGLDVDPKLLSSGQFSAHGYVALAAEENADEMWKVTNLIRDSMKRSAKARFPDVRKELLAHLTGPERDLQTLAHGKGELSSYLKMPLFADTDPRELADIILRHKRLDHALVEWLAERYGSSASVSALRTESDWLCGLYDELHHRVAIAPPPLNTFWAEIVRSRLQPALARLGDGTENQPTSQNNAMI